MKHVLPMAVAAFVIAFFGRPASAQAPALTNADITRLVAMRVSDQTVIAVIQEAAATQFDLSPRAVIDLAVHEVPTAVIAAMRRPSTSAAKPANEPALPEPSPAGGVQTLAGAAAEAAAATHVSPEPPAPASPAPAPASPAPAPASLAPAPASHGPAAATDDASSLSATDEVYWRARVAPLHQRVRENRAKEGPLLNRINRLTVELSAIGPVNARRGGLEMERRTLTAEVTDLRESLRADMAAIQALEEEGRQAGAPPGWLR
jgi:hypothetical protein